MRNAIPLCVPEIAHSETRAWRLTTLTIYRKRDRDPYDDLLNNEIIAENPAISTKYVVPYGHSGVTIIAYDSQRNSRRVSEKMTRKRPQRAIVERNADWAKCLSEGFPAVRFASISARMVFKHANRLRTVDNLIPNYGIIRKERMQMEAVKHRLLRRAYIPMSLFALRRSHQAPLSRCILPIRTRNRR